MAILKVCFCGRIAYQGNRCPLHPKPPKRTGTYTRNAAKVRAAATTCYLCGLPFTPDDPAVADHVQPRAYGGSDNITNLQAAHRSCNGRKGATLPSWTS
jgi:5-methylcytosine-specific restriction endonuclease McrA